MIRTAILIITLAAASLLAASGTPDGAPPRSAAPTGVDASPIKAGDALDVLVFGHPELSRVVPVQPDGAIAYPFIGRLVVTGKSVDEIAQAVAQALEGGYSMRDPKVSVAIASFSARTVFVVGQVTNSGAHPLPMGRPLTLLQLVALAGGFKDDADRGRLRLYRYQDRQRVERTVDLTRIEQAGLFAEDLELHDGDTVYVPRADDVAVLGQVNVPGSFVMRSGAPLSVLRAIAQAKGFTRLADQGDVLWVRTVDQQRRVMHLDTSDILKGNAEDPVMSPGDILYVTERWW
ncbi:MAG: polysaccharide biosynthesis/export family protein [Planctomycetota bacterium]